MIWVSKYLFSFLILVLGIKMTKVKKKKRKKGEMKEVINDVVKKEIEKN